MARDFIILAPFLFCTHVVHAELIGKVKTIQTNQLVTDLGLPSKSIYSITQDEKGYIWIGTTNGLSRYDGYELVNHFNQPNTSSSLSGNFIRVLHVDKKGALWVGTNKSGLNQFLNPDFKRYVFSKNEFNQLSSNSITAINSNSQGVWVGTDDSLNFIAYDQDDFIQFKLLGKQSRSKETIHSIYQVSDTEFLIGVNGDIVSLNTENGQTKTISVLNQNKIQARTFSVGPNGTLWLGAREGLFKFDGASNTFHRSNHIPVNTPVLNLLSDEHGLWIGTYKEGLFLLNPEGLFKIKSFDNEDAAYIFSSFKDRNKQLWVGTFSNEIFSINSTSLYFNNINTKEFGCGKGLDITSVTRLNNQQSLVGSYSGLYLISDVGNCTPIKNQLTSTVSSENLIIRSIQEIDTNNFIISTDKGIKFFELSSKSYSNGLNITNKFSTYFVFPASSNSLLQGTTQGLYQVNRELNATSKIASTEKFSQSRFITYARLENNKYVFGTTNGLATLEDNFIKEFTDNSRRREHVNTIYADSSVWVGSDIGILYQYDLSGNLIAAHTLNNQPESLIINSITALNNQSNYLWIGTNRGIYKFDKSTSRVTEYNSNDGLFINNFNRNAVFSDQKNDRLFFGGKNSFVYFNPNKIDYDYTPPKVTISKLKRFNEQVKPSLNYEGFLVEQAVDELDFIEFNYKDYVIGFEFSGLHFTDPRRIKYAYKLEGLHDDWVYTDSKNRTATFNNLKPGQYIFKVKAANKDGLWSKEEDNVALNITVHPAPWFSWWAYTLYLLVFLTGLFSFIRYRTRYAFIRAQELEQEVFQRTQEINSQKETIESLLKRKDELFANISHEFRTPLTLILGPLEKELDKLDSKDDSKNLLMIERNAQRLLTMVEQILKLTSLNNIEDEKKIVYNVDKTLLAIVDSFQSLAQNKNIFLEAISDTGVNISSYQDALYVMLGNLLSNAIKYTPNGGNVSVSSSLIGKDVHISVSDTGIGLTEYQQKEVFERFVRLDQSSDQAGTGIGLSIVSELVKKHNGRIEVASRTRQGSSFTLILPTTQKLATTDNYAVRSISHLTYVHEVEANPETIDDVKQIVSNSQDHVLIIDDNDDMRDYIEQVLSNEYQCITTDNGQRGLDIAKTSIPDLIICDIMMPGMDGYEVARVLRNDVITSHIPLILLTAKGDKKSRIKGWNENIDDFMTKPFDVTELLSRVNNLISVRKILSQKISTKLSDKSNSENTHENISLLNKKEQIFLDKFMNIISNNYSDMYFQKSDFMKKMHTSERQLHRKIKALTNKTPMEILKEYRLRKATEFLLDGENVNKTLEKCGFNSNSNFSRSFRAAYGMSPKQYQLTQK